MAECRILGMGLPAVSLSKPGRKNQGEWVETTEGFFLNRCAYAAVPDSHEHWLEIKNGINRSTDQLFDSAAFNWIYFRLGLSIHKAGPG